MLLRIGLRLILNEVAESKDEFGDITDVCLRGPLGHLWIALRIEQLYRSKWNYVWYVPFLVVVLGVFLSPLLVCVFFIYQLLRSGELVLSLLYGGLLIPYLAFFVLLLFTAAILGIGENTVRIDKTVAEQAELVAKLSSLQ